MMITNPSKDGVPVGLLALLSSIVVSFLAASSAPTPLYATYAREWHFSPITTTIVFAVYSLTVLVALLVLGRISDHVGRRPVLLAALALQIIAVILLAAAGNIEMLLVARILQGVATGFGIGALGAAMLDVHHSHGTVLNAAAPGLGTGAGSLLSGLLVQFAPAPAHLIYVVLLACFLLQTAGVFRLAESGARQPGARRTLIPTLAVPPEVRGAFIAAGPILFATWALAGFYGSLGPALAARLSGSSSAVLGGLGFFLLATVGSATTFMLRDKKPQHVMTAGVTVLILAMAGTLAATQAGSAGWLFICTALAGIGFGAGFQGGIRTVVPLAAPQQRSGVLSAVYSICYLGMSVPAVVAGVLVVHGGGLIAAARDYAIFVIALSVLTLALSARQAGRRAKTGQAHSIVAPLDDQCVVAHSSGR